MRWRQLAISGFNRDQGSSLAEPAPILGQTAVKLAEAAASKGQEPPASEQNPDAA
jgi:hypothetical protein